MKTSRRLLISVTAVLILLLAIVPSAFAGNFHFNAINFNIGNSLDFATTIFGLTGNQAFQITVTATGLVTVLCEDPEGNQVPGQNPISVESADSVMGVTNSGGRAKAVVEVPDPASSEIEPAPTPEEAGCPDGDWEVTGIQDLPTNWTSARIVVLDGFGVVQVDKSFTCTTSFKEGLSARVTCSEV
jgi:hypothetical protein